MRMCVRQFFMPMRMRVRITGRIIRSMSVLVMFIVCVPMNVLLWVVMVRVFVSLGQVQPDAGGHERGGNNKSNAQRIAKEGDRHRRTHEWCN